MRSEFAALALVILAGCASMGRLETANAVSASSDECIANQIAIVETCTTPTACRVLLEAERKACRERRAAICADGKGC